MRIPAVEGDADLPTNATGQFGVSRAVLRHVGRGGDQRHPIAEPHPARNRDVAVDPERQRLGHAAAAVAGERARVSRSESPCPGRRSW